MTKGTDAFNFNWMVKYTPQTAWITGKGVYLWLAFFFAEIFAGVYFISIFMNLRSGLMVGWLGSLLLGGGFHYLYLGKADRGWRILFKVGRSELSRGLWVILFFSVIGFIQIIPIVIPGLPWSWNAPTLKILMGIISVLVIIHGFMTMSVVRALPMWNNSMMIPLSFASGLWVGSQIVGFLLMVMGAYSAMAELWCRWSLFLMMAAVLVYLWGSYHGSDTVKASIKRLFAGDCALQFYIGVLLIGICIPLIITLSVWGSDLSNVNAGLVILRLLCVLIGDAAIRYVIMKAPLYPPLV
jgi:formate-dependent nitrite reductase membrane component NrfD